MQRSIILLFMHRSNWSPNEAQKIEQSRALNGNQNTWHLIVFIGGRRLSSWVIFWACKSFRAPLSLQSTVWSKEWPWSHEVANRSLQCLQHHGNQMKRECVRWCDVQGCEWGVTLDLVINAFDRRSADGTLGFDANPLFDALEVKLMTAGNDYCTICHFIQTNRTCDGFFPYAGRCWRLYLRHRTRAVRDNSETRSTENSEK
jgi:hypothetical protein